MNNGKSNVDSAYGDRKAAGVPEPANKNSKSDKIRQEVEKLTQKGYPSSDQVADLFEKYREDEKILDEILRAITKRHTRIKEKMRELAQKIYRKYSNGERPMHEIMEKMIRYKTKHKWSDYEFDELRRELINLTHGRRALEIDYNQNISVNRSRINRALGNTSIPIDKGIRIRENEEGVLAEILRMHQDSYGLYRSIMMHSLMYTDCSPVAMSGTYDRNKNIADNHIHPLIAAMFLPKLDIFEIHMLHSNFGSIVKARKDKRPYMTEPDLLLFQDITSDPNDVVCEINSPMMDIRNRFRVQIALYSTVLNLRNGRYYDDKSSMELFGALQACRNNIYDNVDLIFNNDDGALLRRLLSVFSLRPTFVKAKPLYNITSFTGDLAGVNFRFQQGHNNNFDDQHFSYNSMGLYPYRDASATLTNIPMITVQLTPGVNQGEPIDLRNAMSQTLWINEKGNMIPKEHEIIASKEVLIFYVNRIEPRAQLRTYTNPIYFNQLPITASEFPVLNTYPVNVPHTLTIRRSNEPYNLRSVVAVTQNEIRSGDKVVNWVTGQTALIMSHRDFSRGSFEPKYFLYDPKGASIPVEHPEKDGEYMFNKPISTIDPFFAAGSDDQNIYGPSFFDRAQRTGSIFIYAKADGYNPREMIAI